MSRRRVGFALLITVVACAFVGSVVGARMLRGRAATATNGQGAAGPAGGGAGTVGAADSSEGAGGAAKAARDRPAHPQARRIVSLAPSVTETLFAVGCGSRVVGVTTYCRYPKGARSKPAVGGYINPNLEAIVGRRPDLVVGTSISSHTRSREALQRMGIPVIRVDHSKLEGVLSSYGQLARYCGTLETARKLERDTRARLARVRQKTRGRPRRSALIVFGRSGQGGTVREVFVAGRTGLYEEILQLAGGRNAFQRKVPAFPKLSLEGVLRLDPDAIVELASDRVKAGRTVEGLRRGWLSVPQLTAVREDRIHLVTGGYGQVPGPRLFRLVEDVARALHPEADWGTP